MKKIVCVLGMHRSGTSLFARMLNILGVYLGPEGSFLPPRPDNPKGFWELGAIREVNDEILRRLGGRWDAPPVLHEGWEIAPGLDDLRRRAGDIIEENFLDAQVWGWKDPRSCLTLPFWRRIVEPSHYLLCLRNPIDVVGSLGARDCIGARRGARLWVDYVRSSLAKTSDCRRLPVFFEDTVEDWRGQVRRICEFIGPPIVSPTPDAEVAIDEFVERGPRNHSTSLQEAIECADLPFAAKALYSALRSLNPSTAIVGGCPTGLSLPVVETFANACHAAEHGLSTEGMPEDDVIQVFWDAGNGFVLDNSDAQPIILDGRLRRITFRLPSGAGGPLRLDPGSRPLFGEIQSVLVFPDGVDPLDSEAYVASWSEKNGFDGLIASNDLIRVPGAGPYRFITLGNDPQILLSLDLSSEARSYLVQITIRLLEDFRDAAAGELGRLIQAVSDARVNEDALRASLMEAEGRLSTTIAKLAAREHELDLIKASRGWRLLSQYGKVKHSLLRPARKVAGVLRNGHTTVSPRFEVPTPLVPYDAWLEVNEWNERRASLLRERLAAIDDPPFLSVVMPVYNPLPEFLNRAIQSVVDQVYPKWELSIADDASTDERIVGLIEDWAEREPRIRLVFRKTNGGISAAANTAAENSTGDYLVFLDNDDELSPDALGEVACYISRQPDTDVLYSDEDKMDPAGRRYGPHFKPDWSPELLLSFMYMVHLFIVRRTLFQQVGGFRGELDGSQDYDLALRATEIARHVGHIPKVLYHWRALPTSTASTAKAKPRSLKAGQAAVQQALERRGIKADVFHPEWAARIACGYYAHRFPDDGPRVAILIPTRNQLRVLQSCIKSLAKTTYTNYEVVIIDNGSDDPETLVYLSESPHRVLRIPSPGGKFSFAAVNNEAVRHVDSDYVLFLNNDTQVTTPEWLSQMVGYLGIAGVGAVGARLLFPNRRIQHAGVVRGYHRCRVGHAFKNMPGEELGYYGYAAVTRNYAAVTAACMLTPRDLFARMGGFDESTFSLAFNDVDYCYRLLAQGLRSVYCPTAELIHHESYSRGQIDNPSEEAAFRIKYGALTDPYYNVNLSLEHERFAIDARTVAGELPRPIPALICTHNLNIEGAPLDQLEMIAGLKSKGIIEPIVCSPQDGPVREEYEERGIRVEIVSHPLSTVSPAPDAYESAIRRFSDWIGDLNVELVYGNTLLTFYGIEAAAARGLPSVWNPRESEPWQEHFSHFGNHIAGRALKCFGYPYKVVFTASSSMSQYREFDAHHNFTTIYDGLDRNRFLDMLKPWPRSKARRQLGLAEEDVALITVGTTCDRKGQTDIIAALSNLEDRVARCVRWYIVGDRPSDFSDGLHQAIHDLPESLASRIVVVPETPNVARYYRAADIYVCNSRFESFPRVILEAMAAGLPIITTPVFGISEQVRPDVNALMYQPGDTAKLAENVTRLVEDAALRRAMASASPVVLDSLIDYESMVDAYAKVFQEAWLSGKPRGYQGL
jgi:GT2 family glycosyltransferase/glycosyltransferase involved in cell wall biosynthesis